ncbi:MAG: GNAT family N-acetyltransferase [Candidatus Binatia bacterium]
MDVQIRPAIEADMPFLAWVQQEAARSHLPLGFWDLAFPGAEADRLRIVRNIGTSKRPARSFCHWSGFLVAEADGQVAAALSGYTNPTTAGGSALFEAIGDALDAEQWNAEQRQGMALRMQPFLTCIPDTAEDAWIIEWVATKPECRGKGLVRALLHAILARGREQGHAQAQIAVLIGNTPAQRAYEGVGFRVADEKTHADFERAVGSPGIRRLLRPIESSAR